MLEVGKDRGGERGERVQVLDVLEELEGAVGEFLGGWVEGQVDSVGGAVVAWFGLGHGCVWERCGIAVMFWNGRLNDFVFGNHTYRSEGYLFMLVGVYDAAVDAALRSWSPFQSWSAFELKT